MPFTGFVCINQPLPLPTLDIENANSQSYTSTPSHILPSSNQYEPSGHDLLDTLSCLHNKQHNLLKSLSTDLNNATSLVLQAAYKHDFADVKARKAAYEHRQKLDRAINEEEKLHFSTNDNRDLEEQVERVMADIAKIESRMACIRAALGGLFNSNEPGELPEPIEVSASLHKVYENVAERLLRQHFHAQAQRNNVSQQHDSIQMVEAFCNFDSPAQHPLIYRQHNYGLRPRRKRTSPSTLDLLPHTELSNISTCASDTDIPYTPTDFDSDSDCTALTGTMMYFKPTRHNLNRLSNRGEPAAKELNLRKPVTQSMLLRRAERIYKIRKSVDAQREKERWRRGEVKSTGCE